MLIFTGENLQFQIKVRQTEDWGNLTNESFLDSYKKKFEFASNFGQDKTPEKHFESFNKNIILWNKKFVPSFYQYRQKVKDIALENWSKTGIEVSYDDIILNDVIYIPTDDDDWFAPEIKEVLENLFKNEEIRLVVWNGLFLNKDIKIYERIASNGYAFRNIFDLKILKYHCFPELLLNENYTLKSNKELSVWVRHSASWCVLTQSFNITKLNKNVPFWAASYVDKLNSIDIENKIVKL